MKRIRYRNPFLRRGGRSLIFVLLFLFLALPVSATTYYVDNCVILGSDLNNGTSTLTPWLTIARVNAWAFNPGDSLLFESTCTWREQLTVSRSGSPGNPITIANYGTGSAPIISGANLLTSWHSSGHSYASVSTQPHQVFRDGSRLTQVSSEGSLAAGDWWWDSGTSSVYVYDNPNGHAIEASQRDYSVLSSPGIEYVTIANLHLTKANQFGVGLNGGYATINKLISDYNYKNGILYYGDANDILTGGIVENSTVAYNGGSGIAFGYVNDFLIQGNEINDNALDPLQTSARGIDGGNLYTTNVTVQWNYVHENGSVAAGSAAGGIACDTCGSEILIAYNNVWGNNGFGIDIDADNNVMAYYNLSWNNLGDGIIAFADANASMTSIQLYNNTVYGNYGFGIRMMGPSSGNAPTRCTNISISNNISVNTKSGPNFAAYNGCENPGTNGSGNVYTYNDFGAQASNFIQWGASMYESTYSAWDTAAGNCGSIGCSHSIQTAPIFNNPAAGNFTLASGSSAIDAGANIGTIWQLGLSPSSSWPTSISTLNQNSYGSGWEVGAFVFVQSTQPSPPSSLSIVIIK